MKSLKLIAFLSILFLVNPSFAADGAGYWLGSAMQFEGAPSITSSYSLDEQTDYVAGVRRCEEGETINALTFWYTARTGGVGTPPTFQISLQGVDASGNPDGVIKGSTNNAKAVFTPPPDGTWDSTRRVVTLGETYTCTRQEALAEKIIWSSGTINGTNASAFGTQWTNYDGNSDTYTVKFNATGATTTRSSNSYEIPWGWTSASKTYGNPTTSTDLTQYSTGEHGAAVTIPAGWCNTARIKCVRWWGRTGSAGASLDVDLYSDLAATTLIAHGSIDTDTWLANGANQWNKGCFADATLPTLTCGTTYYAGVKPTSGTPNTSILELRVNSAGDLAAFANGTTIQGAIRAAGAFTVTNTTKPIMEFQLDDLTPPATSATLNFNSINPFINP